MNTSYQISSSSFWGSQSMFFGNGLKSTEQKLERQAERDNQIAFFEKQKENLKNMKCETPEEIMEKLKMFHSYEDQIQAAKQEYNDQQMSHVLDEMLERAEKIAEAAEKTKPKTEEERREDRIEEAEEEALGTEKRDDVLEEITDELEKLTENLEEAGEISEETVKKLEETVEASEENLEETVGGSEENMVEIVREKVKEEGVETKILAERTAEGLVSSEQETERIKIQGQISYRRIDILV